MTNFDLLYILGVLEIGTTISAFLFGITTLQAYIYYSRFPEDRWPLKTLVIAVWLLELGHVITVVHYFFTISITQYGHPEKFLGMSPVSLDAGTFLSGVIDSLVQAFFADRVRRISRKPYLAIFCWFLSLVRFVAATGITIVLLRVTMVDFLEHWRWLVTFTCGVGAGADIIIAVVLCYDLSKRRKASFKDTTQLLDRLIVITIQTGLFTSLMTVGATICFLTMADNFIWLAIYLCLARVFSNSLLASLNARTRIRQMHDNIHSIEFAGGTRTNVQDTLEETRGDLGMRRR